jgi:hypothetical protein
MFQTSISHDRSIQMEDNMTNFKTSLIITAFLSLGALSLTSISAKADVTGQLGQCRAFTTEKVVRCCEHIIRTSGRPAWMIDNHDTCRTTVSCSGKQKLGAVSRRRLCNIQVTFAGNPSSGTPAPAKPTSRGAGPN